MVRGVYKQFISKTHAALRYRLMYTEHTSWGRFVNMLNSVVHRKCAFGTNRNEYGDTKRIFGTRAAPRIHFIHRKKFNVWDSCNGAGIDYRDKDVRKNPERKQIFNMVCRL